MNKKISHTCHGSVALSHLTKTGLRPTRQRIALAELLLAGENRHVTAEELHQEARGLGISVSLATVYNALHQFTFAGLMREVIVEAGRSYFDTNTSDHHHFFYEDKGELEDIPSNQIKLSELPEAPKGTIVKCVDVIVRVNSEGS